MPLGTASNRLRKALLFELARRLGLLCCFQCGEPISTVDDLSIEHKEPWQSAADPVTAFFSMENIAFSHLVCNIGAATKTRGPCGTNAGYGLRKCRCPLCREFKREQTARLYRPEKRREKYLKTGH